MKKEKSLNFLNFRHLMMSLFVIGLMGFGSVSANAQNGPMQKRIQQIEDLRDSFIPGTAKYDRVQDAVDYLIILDNGLANDPNYLTNLSEDQDPFENHTLRSCLLYTSPSPRDQRGSRMPSSA